MTKRRVGMRALVGGGLNWVLLAGCAFTAGSCATSREVWQTRPAYADVFESAGVNGTFVLHRLGTNEYRTNDRQRAEKRFLPASTFKIFNALVALETGVIADQHETFAWDGVERQVPAWNQDHDLASGIRVSAVWYFQELARRIGSERMQHWIDAVGYGNQDMGGDLDSFWLKGDIRISPIEHIRFLERLLTNDLPFSERSMRIVKEILILETSRDWALSGKTGWGGNGDSQVGWFVGYVERSDAVWVFANNLEILADEDARHRVGISRQILSAEGIIDPTEPLP